MGSVGESLVFWVVAAVGERFTREPASPPRTTARRQQPASQPTLTGGDSMMTGSGLKNPTTPR